MRAISWFFLYSSYFSLHTPCCTSCTLCQAICDVNELWQRIQEEN